MHQLRTFGDFLRRSSRKTALDPEATYRRLTVKLWGQGLAIRDELLGAQIAANAMIVVEAGQFVMSRIDARHGAYALIDHEFAGAVVSNDFPVFELDRTIIEPRFLLWLSRTPAFVKMCRIASEGTTNRVRLKDEEFLASAVLLPPIQEQRRLVASVDRMADLVAEARALQREVDEKLHHLTVATHLAAAQKPAEMSEFLELTEDQVSVSAEMEYPQVGIRAHGSGMFAKPPVAGSDTTYRVFNRLHDDMLVLSQVKGWEGAVAVCDKELAGRFASPEYRTFKCRPSRLYPAYLRALVSTPWFHAKLAELTRGQGARRQRVRPELFLSMELEMPSYRDQQKAASVFANGWTIREIHATQRSEIDQLLPSLLGRIFHGVLQTAESLEERPAA